MLYSTPTRLALLLPRPVKNPLRFPRDCVQQTHIRTCSRMLATPASNLAPTCVNMSPTTFSVAGTSVSWNDVRNDSVTASRMKFTSRGITPSMITFLMRDSSGLASAAMTSSTDAVASGPNAAPLVDDGVANAEPALTGVAAPDVADAGVVTAAAAIAPGVTRGVAVAEEEEDDDTDGVAAAAGAGDATGTGVGAAALFAAAAATPPGDCSRLVALSLGRGGLDDGAGVGVAAAAAAAAAAVTAAAWRPAEGCGTDDDVGDSAAGVSAAVSPSTPLRKNRNATQSRPQRSERATRTYTRTPQQHGRQKRVKQRLDPCAYTHTQIQRYKSR